MMTYIVSGLWVDVDSLERFGVRYSSGKMYFKDKYAIITDSGLAFVGDKVFALTVKREGEKITLRGDEVAPVMFNVGIPVFWDYKRNELFRGEPSITLFIMGKVDTTYKITIESGFGGKGFSVKFYEDSVVVLAKGLYGKFRKVLGDGKFVSHVDVLHTMDSTKFIIHLGFGGGKTLLDTSPRGITLTLLPLRVKKESRVPVIVIDPGHGGRDAGAVANGYKEKNINLAVALKVANILKSFGYEVILTRSGDEYVSLSKRSRIANKSNADIFVSIHCNASGDGKAGGLETYFLSESRTSEERAVAILENSAIRYDLGNMRMKDDVEVIVGDLIQTLLLEQSYKLASYIHEKALEMNLTEDRGLKQAGFYVLKWVGMPSVLIEIGFITHKEEVKKLTDAKYQNRIARAIALGIREFMERESKK